MALGQALWSGRLVGADNHLSHSQKLKPSIEEQFMDVITISALMVFGIYIRWYTAQQIRRDISYARAELRQVQRELEAEFHDHADWLLQSAHYPIECISLRAELRKLAAKVDS